MEEKFEVIEGIKCYAPELARENSGFKEESFDHLFKLEDGNFWFEGRAKIMKHLFRKFSNDRDQLNFLEIGCGTGFMLKRFSGIPKVHLTGSEIYLAGLHFARKRLPRADFIQLDATNMPFRQLYDTIGAFDVLEHIEADEQVMDQVHKALKNNGNFLITVPQYSWLWSPLDDYACHKRRYSRKDLITKIKRQGFEIEYVGSFVFWLFPFMLLSRLLKKNQQIKDPTSEFQIPAVLNLIFSFCMRIDYLLIKMGISLPFGGSLVCVATKKPNK